MRLASGVNWPYVKLIMSFPTKFVVCFLALVIGVLPLQGAAASIGKCETPASDQLHTMLGYNSADVDHIVGYEEPKCSTCVEHQDCRKSSLCSSENCSVSIVIPPSASNSGFDRISLIFSDHLSQKLPHFSSFYYRPPLG